MVSGRMKKVLTLVVAFALLICLGTTSVFANASDTADVPEAVSEEDAEVTGTQLADDESVSEFQDGTDSVTDDVNSFDSGGDDDSTVNFGGDNESGTPDSTLPAAPTLSAISNTASGVEIIWSSVDDAASYNVYRKTSGSWSRIGSSASTSYTDKSASSGTTYYYTVSAVSSEGAEGTYDEGGLSIKYLAAPALSSAGVVKTGIEVKWKSVDGASKYRVYRKTSSSGSWKKLTDTTSTSYTDTTASAGNTYIYTVSAIDSSGNESSYDSDGLTLKYLKTPALSSISNVKGGVKVSWGSVSGAAKYRVYRKTSGASWSKIAETASTSYTDTTAKSGTTYIYTVRTLNDSGWLSSYYDTSGISIKYLAAPALSKAEAVSGGIKVSWGKVSGASKYRVYRKTSGGSWSRLAETTATSYTDKTAKTGTTYIYTVRAISGSYISWYDSTGVSLKYLATPKLSSSAPASTGVKVTWSKVSGASGYRVYRKTSGGSWSKIAETTSTSYTDTTAKTNTTYYYTVRALDSKGVVSSYYDTSGVKLKYLATPKLSSAAPASGGIKVTWSKVSGASKYRVYRKTSGGSWSKIAETTSTSYTDKSSLKNNTTYIYTVRALNSDKVLGSWYDSTGVSLKYLKTPALSSAVPAKDGIKVTWSSVSGAKKYRVYRKVSGGSWSKITETTSTSYTDTTAKTNKTYYYTVRAINSDGVLGSYYDTSGVKLKYLATVKLGETSNATSGVKVTWSSVSGAKKYRVYRKTSGGSWSKIGDSTSTSYTDTSAKSGTTYIYTVRAINSDGVLGGWYDSAGISQLYLEAPTVTVANGSNCVKVTWTKTSGAEGYRVYRKTTSGSWSRIADISSGSTVSYTDKSISKATGYYYTVRAVSGSVLSAYNSGVTYGTAMDIKAQNYSSSTKYLIMVDCTKNQLGVYVGSKGNWVKKYLWKCTTGKSSTPTAKGTYKIYTKQYYFISGKNKCWYFSPFHGGYGIHSVLYEIESSPKTIRSGTLGKNLSHGCVRLALENAKWIYNNCPVGTTVVTY